MLNIRFSITQFLLLGLRCPYHYQFLGALDAIGEEKTWRGCAEVVNGLGGGRVVSNLPAGFTNVPEGVEVVGGE